MRKIGLALAATTCLTFAVSIASAADLRPAYKAPPPPPPPVFTWTGFYIGAHLGGTWGSKEYTFNAVGLFGDNSQTTSGFLGGAQVGYNYQVANIVWGVEAQFSWTNAEGRGNCANSPGALTNCRVDIDWFGTVAGRVGYAIDRYLPYVKVGGAWVHDKHSFLSPAGVTLDSIDRTRWGWMWGAGVEYALSSGWSAKIEYDYLSFDRETFSLPGTAVTAGTPVSADIRQTMHLIKAGVNWRFGYGGYGGYGGGAY